MRRGISPKKEDPGRKISIGVPSKAFTAGMDVAIATSKTKKKLTNAFIFEGNKGMLRIPMPTIIADDRISQKLSIFFICLNFKNQLGYFIDENTLKYNQI